MHIRKNIQKISVKLMKWIFNLIFLKYIFLLNILYFFINIIIIQDCFHLNS